MEEQIKKLFVEYTSTLDDEHFDEFYNSPKGFAVSVLTQFLDWLGVEYPEDFKEYYKH